LFCGYWNSSSMNGIHVRRNETAMRWRKILLAGSLSILVGCQHEPVKPTKPTLQIEMRADGGFCLDQENARKLGVYIQELERQ